MFAKTYSENERFIFLKTYAVRTNILYAIVVFIFIVLGLTSRNIIFLGVGITAVILFVFLFNYFCNLSEKTIIDKKNRKIINFGRKTDFSDYHCLLLNSDSIKGNGNDSGESIYFNIYVCTSLDYKQKNLDNIFTEYWHQKIKDKKWAFDDRDFDDFDLEEDSYLDESYDPGDKIKYSPTHKLVSTTSEKKVWYIAKRISKIMNIPIVDISANVIIKKPSQLKMPYHKALKLSAIPVSELNLNRENLEKTIKWECTTDKSSFCVKWGEPFKNNFSPSITIRNNRVELIQKRATIGTHTVDFSLDDIEIMHVNLRNPYSHIGFIGADIYEKALFRLDHLACEEAFRSIQKHFLQL